MTGRAVLLCLAACLLLACSDAVAESGGGGGAAPGAAAGAGGPLDLPTTFGDDRPVELHVPSNYDPAAATPLLILLHGYSASGQVQDIYWGFKAAAAEAGMLYAHPDGTIDQADKRFWNATPACCNFYGAGVDDSGYLRKLIDDIRMHYNVDSKRIYFSGHSNGGFMSYRMACDHADVVAAIATLAGASFLDADDCLASEPVHVLHMHGTMDATIDYQGADLGPFGYPSALESVMQWVERAQCDPTASDEDALDIDNDLAGAETTVKRWSNGCAAGGSADLWTLEGGGHIPAVNQQFVSSVMSYLLSHPKP